MVAHAAERSSEAASGDLERIWRLLDGVPDPEIPVVSVVDLGIIRHVRWTTALHIGITPTYSGCPATEVIRSSIRTVLDAAGYGDAVLEEVLSPPWTTDWISAAGREKLRAFGIAPPNEIARPRHISRATATAVACPRCASSATERISEFGSTPCKAHYRCTACLEPFDHFKCL